MNRPRVSQLGQSGAVVGQVIAWNGTEWAPSAPFAVLNVKGDLIVATADDTAARLAVGTDGQVLTADSSTATGLKWASPAYTPTRASDLTTAIVPLTTAVAGSPDLVWDADDNLVLIEVAYP